MVWSLASIKPILKTGGSLAGTAAASAVGSAAGTMVFNRAIDSRIAALVLPSVGDGLDLYRQARNEVTLSRCHEAGSQSSIVHLERAFTLAQNAASQQAGIESCEALLLAGSCCRELGNNVEFERCRAEAKTNLRDDNKLLFRCCSFLRRISDTIKNYGSIQAFFLGGTGVMINAATLILPGAPAIAALRLCLSISAAGFSGLILAKILTELEASLLKIENYGRSEFGGSWFGPEMLDRLHPEQLPFGFNQI